MNSTMSIFLLIIMFSSIEINCFINQNDKIIISLSSTPKNIQNSMQIINSITAQNVDKDLYEIILIISSHDYKDIIELPSEIQSLEKSQTIKIISIKEELTNLSKLTTAFKEYENNPILIINNNCILPPGWLDMFINDHRKYPNDAIVASIQYFFGKDGEIKEFSDGFNGEKFGIFNQVSNMIFNFALINSDFGGILYPKNFFQNKLFYDKDLFLKSTNNNDDFWQSCFIIIEDKILRQSSKIFDYTKYLINDNYENKKPIYEKIKSTFIENFPNFQESLIKRQNKILVSFTSYPKRFPHIPILMKSIKEQNYTLDKIFLFVYKEDYKQYNYNLDGLNVVPVEKDIKPHEKYFYAMKSYRDHAVITLDDDSYYNPDTFRLLVNSYINNPNIVSGIRAHYITYKNNGETKKYTLWSHQRTDVIESDFNIFLTGCSGILYPPDIFNIDDSYLPIIEETVTCDDITLKYFEIRKGIPEKWIENKNFLNPSIIVANDTSQGLNVGNEILNDVCIDKLNLNIKKTILNNLCANFKDIQTGNTIYLFDIYNKKIIDNKLYFNINAYSYCPIDSKIKFNISFDKLIAYCSFSEPKFDINNIKINKMVAVCFINDININLDDYNPIVNSERKEKIKMYNYRKSLTTIFKSFKCQESNNCILKVILLDKINNNINMPLYITNKNYLCKSTNNNESNFDNYPIIKDFKCTLSNSLSNISKIYISGLPLNDNNDVTKIDNNIIPNQFIVRRIVYDNEFYQKQIIIVGNVDLNGSSFEFFMNFINPKATLKCHIKAYSKYVQSKIYCYSNLEINSEILFENQIVYSSDNKFELLLMNQETLIKVNNTNDINDIDNPKIEEYFIHGTKDKSIFSLIIILLIIIIIMKLFRRVKTMKSFIGKKRKRQYKKSRNLKNY